MFLLETLTPMHVGSGDITFGVVDNLIQKNPFTNIPVINASSLKGSLREHFEKKVYAAEPETNFTKTEIEYLFGKPTDMATEDDTGAFETSSDSSPGRMIIFEANLLTLPLRSSQKVYFNATSHRVLKDYSKYHKSFFDENKEFKLFINVLDNFILPKLESKDFVIFTELENLEIEDYENGEYFSTIDSKTDNMLSSFIKDFIKVAPGSLAVFNDDIFSAICERKLPVIARNNIGEDGTSKNLFYEEVLPRKSVLYFLLGEEQCGTEGNGAYNKFVKYISDEKDVYQFGANYSIGYGFSNITKIV
jgi:CRISPR-associated protein Cmr4